MEFSTRRRRANRWRSDCRWHTTRRFPRRASGFSGCDLNTTCGRRRKAPMSYTHLLTRRDGGVEYLTLNRPDVRNAFNEHVIAELMAWATETRTAAERHE